MNAYSTAYVECIHNESTANTIYSRVGSSPTVWWITLLGNPTLNERSPQLFWRCHKSHAHHGDLIQPCSFAGHEIALGLGLPVHHGHFH